MKINTIVLFSIGIAFVFGACNKNNSSAPQEVKRRLTSYTLSDGTNNSLYSIKYNDNGKITEIDVQTNGQPSAVWWTIEYSGNDIIMLDESSITNILRDTMRLTVDANGRRIKRIRGYFRQDNGGTPSVEHLHDSSDYQYDATGFLVKEIRHYGDTISYTNGDRTFSRTIEVFDYTNSNSNLASVVQVSNDTVNKILSGMPSTYITTRTITANLNYTKGSLNKTDFTNEAIIGQLYLFFPYIMHKEYGMVPQSMNYQQVRKRPDGTITGSSNDTYLFDFGYDSTGYIISKVQSAPTINGFPVLNYTFHYEPIP